MGVIALIRQTFLDSDWYQQAHRAYSLNPGGQTRPESNNALSALADATNQKQSVAIKTEGDLNTIRAIKIAKEFDLNTWIVGSGHEYRQIETLAQAQIPIVVPVNFPKIPEVESPEAAINVSLMDLSHWDSAPRNPKILYQADISFAITSSFLEKPENFHKNLRHSIALGLPESVALSALTTTPAKIMGVSDLLGTIDVGKLGHLVVANGKLFSGKARIQSVWVDGSHYEVERLNDPDPRGKWNMALNLPGGETLSAQLELKGKLKKLTGNIIHNSDTVKLSKANIDLERINLVFPGDGLGFSGIVRLSGLIDEMRLAGKGELPDGSSIRWTAELKESPKAEKTVVEIPAETGPGDEKLLFPLGAYTSTQVPEQPKHVLVRNATIWTCGPKGKLENADLLVTQGKIKKIGENLSAPRNATVIDAAGKHVTPGLIDEHSHTGISQSVNESSQAVTAEVRIKDVIDNRDIAFYRELAGGLTIAHQLHGSANPIGGQSSVVKLRWGASPGDFQISEAKPGIKFALGENVKQSNWGDADTTRYPQTRMGVEQIIRDRFKAALDYEKEWANYKLLKKKKGIIPPRRDLELEALLEVLKGERDIHSHGYRQDEMLMLIRVAEDFGFTIGTFEHVLEGYKIADVIAQHGAGASAFSDWWAYKFEVYDAIPYAGALMHDVGVVVAFNSDSDELARRMNLEAAKAVKYGSVSEEEALKFVTLNPAKQLKIDHLVGSLELGKDGDFVIWSGNPLSTYTRCEQTWIDGRKYFDIEQDRNMQEQVKAERARLIQKILVSIKNNEQAE
jgi:imidazolonepropionase-like amidohydrolase